MYKSRPQLDNYKNITYESIVERFTHTLAHGVDYPALISFELYTLAL